MRDERQTNDEQLKIELLSQWKLEAESLNFVSPARKSKKQGKKQAKPLKKGAFYNPSSNQPNPCQPVQPPEQAINQV